MLHYINNRSKIGLIFYHLPNINGINFHVIEYKRIVGIYLNVHVFIFVFEAMHNLYHYYVPVFINFGSNSMPPRRRSCALAGPRKLARIQCRPVGAVAHELARIQCRP